MSEQNDQNPTGDQTQQQQQSTLAAPPANVIDPVQGAAALVQKAKMITQDLMVFYSLAEGIVRAVGESNLPIEYRVTLRNLFFTIQGRQGSLMELQTPDLLSLEAFANLVGNIYVYTTQHGGVAGLIENLTRGNQARRVANTSPSTPTSDRTVEQTATIQPAVNTNTITTTNNVVRAQFGKKPTQSGNANTNDTNGAA